MQTSNQSFKSGKMLVIVILNFDPENTFIVFTHKLTKSAEYMLKSNKGETVVVHKNEQNKNPHSTLKRDNILSSIPTGVSNANNI